MSKYSVPDDHWTENDEPEPVEWVDDTSADTEIDVTLHRQGYQEDRKWTVHVAERDPDEELPTVALWAVEHQNKGNFWRPGDMDRDAVDFVDLPLRVRKRVAYVLNRDLETITPSERVVDRADGTGVTDS